MSEHRENRLAERMAILQAEQQLLRRAWSMWHRQAAAHRQERERQAAARAHYQQGQLRKAFWVWRERARGLRTERMGRVRATQLHSARLLHWAWSKWKEVRCHPSVACDRWSCAVAMTRSMTDGLLGSMVTRSHLPRERGQQMRMCPLPIGR
ncbi:PREDICTED: protein SFI1 homolog [Dipodomys ordii]|uniref:Protein SFI1 homolog n=1 Tax=Dipodomys ordii TaxID=10020 RepID=A0A1S3GUP8_DIPOR|nr:PREDICTED: protein SFI1 homolog [Dipodomys ordii]